MRIHLIGRLSNRRGPVACIFESCILSVLSLFFVLLVVHNLTKRKEKDLKETPKLWLKKDIKENRDQ